MTTNIERKFQYSSQWPQEEFIVPLLSREIERNLDMLGDIAKENALSKPSALDCGCGNQPFRDKLEHLGFNYLSLDLSQNSSNSVDLICALDAPRDIFSSTVSAQFELILATEVLEHISNWEQAFQNLYLATSPNGYVLLTAPFFYPLHEEPFDYCRPTLHYFTKAASSAGFEIICADKLGSSIDVIGTALGASRIVLASSNNIYKKVINILLLKLQQCLFQALVRYRTQLRGTGDSVYISNLVILQKP